MNEMTSCTPVSPSGVEGALRSANSDSSRKASSLDSARDRFGQNGLVSFNPPWWIVLLVSLISCARSFPRPQTSSEWEERYRGCRAGDQRACYWRGIADLDEGRTVQGAKTIEKACQAGVGEACNETGFFHSRGWYGFPVNAGRARELWARSCERGSKDGCDSWGTGLRDGIGGPADLPGAVAAYERACKLEDAAGCSNLGSALLAGAGVKRDVARAVTLWRTICARETGIHHSCRLLGAALVHGDGVEQNVTEGLTFMRRACNLGSADDCREAGELMFGFGSKPEAVRYLRTSCTWGSAEGCRALGIRLLEGGEAAEHAEALEVLISACARADQPSCARIKAEEP
jgi:hypothetical protein